MQVHFQIQWCSRDHGLLAFYKVAVYISQGWPADGLTVLPLHTVSILVPDIELPLKGSPMVLFDHTTSRKFPCEGLSSSADGPEISDICDPDIHSTAA
jgi:hypothetical protein